MDYSARLKNRHLVDLIAYMKTSKKSIKPTDEEMNDGEQAEKDYVESCLFIGVMPDETNPRAMAADKIRMDIKDEADIAKSSIYDQNQLTFEGQFEYTKVWSETLM